MDGNGSYACIPRLNTSLGGPNEQQASGHIIRTTTSLFHHHHHQQKLVPRDPLTTISTTTLAIRCTHVCSARAVRCGRKKCVEFILDRMGADTEIPDYGGFTPLLNTGKPSHNNNKNTTSAPN